MSLPAESLYSFVSPIHDLSIKLALHAAAEAYVKSKLERFVGTHVTLQGDVPPDIEHCATCALAEFMNHLRDPRADWRVRLSMVSGFQSVVNVEVVE